MQFLTGCSTSHQSGRWTTGNDVGGGGCHWGAAVHGRSDSRRLEHRDAVADQRVKVTSFTAVCQLVQSFDVQFHGTGLQFGHFTSHRIIQIGSYWCFQSLNKNTDWSLKRWVVNKWNELRDRLAGIDCFSVIQRKNNGSLVKSTAAATRGRGVDQRGARGRRDTSGRGGQVSGDSCRLQEDQEATHTPFTCLWRLQFSPGQTNQHQTHHQWIFQHFPVQFQIKSN